MSIKKSRQINTNNYQYDNYSKQGSTISINETGILKGSPLMINKSTLQLIIDNNDKGKGKIAKHIEIGFRK